MMEEWEGNKLQKTINTTREEYASVQKNRNLETRNRDFFSSLLPHYDHVAPHDYDYERTR